MIITRAKVLTIILTGCLFLFYGALASQITIDNIAVDAGGTATADVIIDEIHSESWQGWKLTTSITDPTVAQVNYISYPSGMYTFMDTTTLPFTSGHFGGIDLTDPPGNLPTGGRNIKLATLSITGLSAGTTTMTTTIHTLDGRSGGDLRAHYTVSSPVITVHGTASGAITPVPITGMSLSPTDPDNDGLYEDINGDGTMTYSDVTLFFYNWHWIESSEPVVLFDFNRNGMIDFGDIVKLNLKIR